MTLGLILLILLWLVFSPLWSAACVIAVVHVLDEREQVRAADRARRERWERWVAGSVSHNHGDIADE